MERIAAGSHWYRRLSILSLIMTGIILVLFVVSLSRDAVLDNALRIPTLVGVLAGITAVTATAALLRGARRSSAGILDAVAYTLLTITLSVLIYMTGGLVSPYLSLWLVLASFSGLFGFAGIGTLAIISNFFIAWQIIFPSGDHGIDRFILAFFTAELPLLVTYIVWHNRPPVEIAAHEATQALQAKLNETSSQAEVVISSIAEGVIAIDQQGIIQLINPAAQALLGWKGNEALGLHYELVLKLVDSREQALANGKNPVEQVRVTKQPIVNNDLTVITNGEHKMLASLVVSPIINRTNQVEAVIVVVRDITSEKAEERARAEFVSTASHEMRTPVAAIEGYVSLALNPATATIDDKARNYLLKAQASVQHLGRLFQDLLQVSRADDNRLVQNPKVTDVVSFAREIVDSLTQKAREKGLTLEFVPDGSHTKEADRKLAPIFYSNFDRDHFREVLANLIENAIKYTPAGTVRVDVQADNRRINVSIMDSGIGIPSQDIPHLFQKFYRVDNSATREIGGTGLGLYLCRKLIESMGGKIWLESELGKGSTFFVSLQRLSNVEVKQLKEAEAISAAHDPMKARMAADAAKQEAAAKMAHAVAATPAPAAAPVAPAAAAPIAAPAVTPAPVQTAVAPAPTTQQAPVIDGFIATPAPVATPAPSAPLAAPVIQDTVVAPQPAASVVTASSSALPHGQSAPDPYATMKSSFNRTVVAPAPIAVEPPITPEPSQTDAYEFSEGLPKLDIPPAPAGLFADITAPSKTPPAQATAAPASPVVAVPVQPAAPIAAVPVSATVPVGPAATATDDDGLEAPTLAAIEAALASTASVTASLEERPASTPVPQRPAPLTAAASTNPPISDVLQSVSSPSAQTVTPAPAAQPLAAPTSQAKV
ncbi:PAS domain-containing protein [Candidatus Saccharibacteria bacterium]|nr:PAS domain-containing protein [Candidatus Saccharibacteria bacterium]